MLGREQTATTNRDLAGLGEAEITGHITRARNILNCQKLTWTSPSPSTLSRGSRLDTTLTGRGWAKAD